jgi:hypothetical protein
VIEVNLTGMWITSKRHSPAVIVRERAGFQDSPRAARITVVYCPVDAGDRAKCWRLDEECADQPRAPNASL